MAYNTVIICSSQDINKMNYIYSIVPDVGNLAELREQSLCVSLYSDLYLGFCSNNWYHMKLNPGGAKFKLTQVDGTSNFGLWKMRVKDLLA